jgi:serine protease Do
MVPEVAEPGDWQGPALRDSAGLRAGELVLAVGNPLGERNAATLGVLVASPSPEDGPLRAAITLRPGNSGGAMADAEGRVVGVPHLAMRGGLGQAVSSRAVQAFLNHDTAAGPPLGISGHWIEVPEGMRGKVPAAIGAGLLIAEVTAGSRAQRAGLLLGDLLVGYGGPGHEDLRPLQPSQDGVAALAGALRLAVLRAGRLDWIEVEHPA